MNPNNSKLKIATTIQHDENEIRSLCFLRDGRLVSGGENGIVVHNKDSFQSDILIKNVTTLSICVLKNGNLASCDNGEINIYEVDGNDYRNIHKLKGHTDWVNKLVELEDGRLCSCSRDKTIKIWDQKYQCVQTLSGNIGEIKCVIEMNDYIVSATDDYRKNVKIWNKNSFQPVRTMQDIYCKWTNSLSKLNENSIILGGTNELFILDVSSFQTKTFQNESLAAIYSVCVLREDRILLGNSFGEIFCYDSLSNKILFCQKVHNGGGVICMIKSKDDKIFSSTWNKIINVYDFL